MIGCTRVSMAPYSSSACCFPGLVFTIALKIGRRNSEVAADVLGDPHGTSTPIYPLWCQVGTRRAARPGSLDRWRRAGSARPCADGEIDAPPRRFPGSCPNSVGGGVVPPRAPVRGQGTARRRAGQDLVRAPQQALAEEDRTPPSAEQRRRPSHSHRLARRSARREAEVPRNATPALQVSRVERRRNLCPRGAADGPGGRTRASGGHQPIDPARSTREGVAQGTEAPDAGVGARRAPEAVAAAVGPRRETQVHPVAHLNPCPLRPAPV